MKTKLLFGILLILCLAFVISCDEFPSLRYEGEHKELYSAAIYAIPGCGEVYDAQIKVLETDSYGRTLFEFTAKGSCLFGRSGKQVNALMIVQESYESGAGYYRDVCYSFTNDAADEDISRRINELKALNDWEKPLNEERTVYRQTTEAPIGNFGDAFRSVPNAYKSLSSGITASMSSFEVYDSNKTGKKIVLWCTQEADDKETYTYYIQFVQVKDGELTEPHQLIAKSLDELQTKIIEGREAFGWSYDLVVQGKWGSFTTERTESFDGKYYALQRKLESNVKVTVYSSASDAEVFSFVPARARDFYGIC